MRHYKQYHLFQGRVYALGLWVLCALGYAFPQEAESSAQQESFPVLHFSYVPESDFVVNPFPRVNKTLVQPLDSLTQPIGLLSFPYQKKEVFIEVAWDWSWITVLEFADGEEPRMPFTADVEWYLDQLHKRNWYVKFLEIMHKEEKDGDRKRRGQMLEVVGVDIGNLGRASLRVSGNVNINGKMVFQDQELVRSTLNQTQNTHLEFDQKQNLNIQGKIGDQITVAMDQDSERDFDWENNIRISYEGYEDDIVQKI